MLNLYELEQFVAFGDCKTLSQASEKLLISQPTLTRSMRHVEEAFGVPLFIRSKNRLELNETGKVALEHARRLLFEAQQAVFQVQAFEKRRKTIVVKSCAPAPLWELMKRLQKTFPGNTVSTEICQNEDVLRAIKSAECDVAVLPFSAEFEGMKRQVLMTERLFVSVLKSHKLSEYSSLTFEDIDGFNFLLRSELGFWDTLCRKKMPASRFLVQTDEFAFNELVESSSLPCFSTDYWVRSNKTDHRRKYIPLTDSEANVTFYVYSKAPLF